MPETDKSIVIAEIDEIKRQSNTGQLTEQYRTIGSEFQGFLLDRRLF
jgi:hypothetical protein